MTTARYDDVLRLAESLTLDDRLQLIAELASETRSAIAAAEPRLKWIDLLGSVPHPALGEDARAWVSRTRQESDDARAG